MPVVSPTTLVFQASPGAPMLQGVCHLPALPGLPASRLLPSARSVYGFATPALGNDALQAAVQEMGWDSRIRNYISPGRLGRHSADSRGKSHSRRREHSGGIHSPPPGVGPPRPCVPYCCRLHCASCRLPAMLPSTLPSCLLTCRRPHPKAALLPAAASGTCCGQSGSGRWQQPQQ